MLRSAISIDSYGRMKALGLTIALALIGACGPARVQVEGEFPSPLLEPIPATLGVWFPNDFKQHEFKDEAKTAGSSGWIVYTGDAQVRMWERLLGGMFANVIFLEEEPSVTAHPDLDGIFIPSVKELQYSIPAHTNIKVYEIWMRYQMQLLDSEGELISEWTMSSYGKTPTAFLQSDEDAVNFAAVMALRDAGANFASNFANAPGVDEWLQSLNRLPEEEAP